MDKSTRTVVTMIWFGV